jgi:diguanylate cyclase (GGDEF)-like protein
VKILIADEDPAVRETIGSLVKLRGNEPIFAADGAEALGILTGDAPPLLGILSAKLPHMDGTDVCREVRLTRFYPYPYLILLSTSTEKEEVMNCLEAGADDCLRKPVQAEELRVRLYAASRLMNAQEKLLAAFRDAEYQAMHDSVSALWNRPSILKIADQYLSKCAKTGDFVALVLVKITGLDEVNERFGTAVGDKLLHEAADRLRTVVPTYDHIGRYVGVKFFIIVPNSSHQRIQTLIGALEKCMRSEEFRVPGGTVRLDVKVWSAENEQRYDTLKTVLQRLERNAAEDAAAKAEGARPAGGKGEAGAKPGTGNGAGANGNSSGAKTVLVLGSDPVDRLGLVRKISALGYGTEQAPTPDTAMDVLHSDKHVDALVLDMRFPDPAELDIVAELKEDPDFSKLPVIVAAAQPIQMTVGRAQNLNVASYMGKPIDPAKLTQILKQLLGAPPAKKPSQAPAVKV